MRNAESRFALFLRHCHVWSASGFQFRKKIAVHLGALAIDGALQLESRAMFLRKVSGNPLAVIRGIVPTLGVFFGERQ